MKLITLLLALFASLIALPAAAQGLSSQYDAGISRDPDTRALAFIRIPLGKQKEPPVPRIGFGLFTGCGRLASQLSAARAAACEAQPVRSLEMSRDLSARDWMISFSGERRWVGIARWLPGSGFTGASESGPAFTGPILSDD